MHLWSVLVGRGILLLLLCVAVLAWPAAALATLVLLFGFFAMLDGIMAFLTLFDRGAQGPRWLYIVEGLVGLAIFAIAFAWPGLTLLSLLYVFAIWAIITGGAQIFSAIQMRKVLEHEWMLVVRGGIAVFFGVVAFIWPLVGAVAVVALLSTFALLNGALSIGAGLRLRSFGEAMAGGPSGGPPAGGSS